MRDDLAAPRPEDADPDAYVFSKWRGLPINTKLWGRRVWTPARERAQVSSAVPYELRHSYATARLYDGAPLHELHHDLGHSSITTTLRWYTHVLAGSQHEKRRPLTETIYAAREQAAKDRLDRQRRLAAPEPAKLDRLARAAARAISQ